VRKRGCGVRFGLARVGSRLSLILRAVGRGRSRVGRVLLRGGSGGVLGGQGRGLCRGGGWLGRRRCYEHVSMVSMGSDS
jgi:hypothetical protein